MARSEQQLIHIEKMVKTEKIGLPVQMVDDLTPEIDTAPPEWRVKNSEGRFVRPWRHFLSQEDVDKLVADFLKVLESKFTVMFICLSNIGRSQMAEAIFNKVIQEKYPHLAKVFAGVSAGLNVDKERDRYGDFIHTTEKVMTPLLMNGVNLDTLSRQFRKQFTPELMDQSTVVVVLCKKEEFPEEWQENPKVIFASIADPRDQEADVFFATMAEVEKIVEGLLENLSTALINDTTSKPPHAALSEVDADSSIDSASEVSSVGLSNLDSSSIVPE